MNRLGSSLVWLGMGVLLGPRTFGQTLGESTKLISPPALAAEYGRSVSIHGDTYMIGTKVVIISGPLSGGAAWLHDAATDALLHTLTNGDTVAHDSMGNSVTLTDGFAVAGAFRDDVHGMSSGSVVVFDASSGSLIEKLLANDGQPGDTFGWSVSAQGSTLAVGAILDDDLGDSAGSVYLFDLTTGSQLAKLLPTDGQPAAHFGWSVALDGDRLVIGAPGESDDLGTNSGAVYVFDVPTGQQLFKLTPSDGGGNDRFGTAVAIEGDRILVGKLEPDLALPGAAYVFDAVTGIELHQLVPPSTEGAQEFGASVSMEGGRAVVGAPYSSQFQFLGGTAYVFDVESGDFLIQLWPTLVSEEAFFGTSVAIGGDVVVVGTPNDLVSGNNRHGSVFRFDLGQLDNPGVDSCFGVGCPCGNDDPEAGCATSLGSGVRLSAQGSASAGVDDLVLRLEGGPAGQSGLIFMGPEAVSLPFGDGLRCVGGPELCRFPIGSFDGGGVLAIGPGLVALSGNLGPSCSLLPGATWHFQGWFRDPQGPCGTGFNTSQARSILVSP